MQRFTHLLWTGRQAVIVIVAIGLYFSVRGLTVGSYDVALAHAHALVDLERDLGIYVEPRLGSLVADSETLATLANWIYIWGHWPVIVVTMIWLAMYHRHHLLRLRDAMIISGILGMLIFASYPLAPPRLAGLGITDTITERSRSYRVLQPPAFVNQYAAMPSLHAGWDLLVGIAIASAATHRAVRLVGVVLPALMMLSVVVTGNHYVLDVVAGIALVLLGHLAARKLDARRARLVPAEELVRRRHPAEHEP